MLNIDLFFHKALAECADLVEVTDGRIYNTARPDKDESEDRLPYIIVTFDGATAGEDTKDEVCAQLEHGTVSVLCVCETRADLANLTEMVYEAIAEELEEFEWDASQFDFCIFGCTPNASAVQYDPDKPCYFQKLTYNCDTESN